MSIFLLKQMEWFIKKAVGNVTTFFYKPSVYASTVAIVAAVAVSPIYAGQQLSDAELDAKYIEVQIRQICTIDSQDSKQHDDNKVSPKVSGYTCSPDNLFVTTIKKDANSEASPSQNQVGNSSSEIDPASLLAGILQNLRSSGRADLLGLPAGVANSGNPLLFGSERYSYAWAGNLNQIFQISPTSTGYWNSIYDTSSLGYGFRAEAHFPYGPPGPSTVQFPNLNVTGRN